jgi:hypothetical protein
VVTSVSFFFFEGDDIIVFGRSLFRGLAELATAELDGVELDEELVDLAGEEEAMGWESLDILQCGIKYIGDNDYAVGSQNENITHLCFLKSDIEIFSVVCNNR